MCSCDLASKLNYVTGDEVAIWLRSFETKALVLFVWIYSSYAPKLIWWLFLQANP